MGNRKWGTMAGLLVLTVLVLVSSSPAVAAATNHGRAIVLEEPGPIGNGIQDCPDGILQRLGHAVAFALKAFAGPLVVIPAPDRARASGERRPQAPPTTADPDRLGVVVDDGVPF